MPVMRRRRRFLMVAAPTLALNFIATPVDAIARTTFTRAASGTYFNASGVLQTASTDVARLDYFAGSPLGLLIEESRTNVVLWNRDLTNAAWTASNVTVAKTATGIDGTANSASTLTASAGNGTVLQAITLASSARFQSAWVKRRTGSGVVNMTMDNGSTWTAVTVTAAWTRVSIPTQTLANPTVGFRIVTSGDAIDVDYVQNENGTFATSSIATTTASVTRAADVCSILTSAFPFNAAEGTLVVSASQLAAISTGVLAGFGDGSNFANSMYIADSGTTALGWFRAGGSSYGGNATLTSINKFAAAYSAATGGFAGSVNGGTPQTGTETIPTVTKLQIGSAPWTANNFWNGHVRSLAYYPSRGAFSRVLAA